MNKTLLVRSGLLILGLYGLVKGLLIFKKCSMYKCITFPECSFFPFYILGGIIFLSILWVLRGEKDGDGKDRM